MKNYQSNLPALSHLQFAVLEALEKVEVMPGKYIRMKLSNRGITSTGPSFYQMMARLEESTMVSGGYHHEVIEGQIIKVRQYQITSDGLCALQKTKNFYQAGRQRIVEGSEDSFEKGLPVENKTIE